jgi:hypothetical protein
MLKGGLTTSRGNLNDVMEKFLLILRQQFKEIINNMATDRQKATHRTNIPLFARVIDKVITHVLKLVLKNHEVMKKHEELPPCTGQFYSATGLPCIHTAQKRVENGEVLRPNDFDPH